MVYLLPPSRKKVSFVIENVAEKTGLSAEKRTNSASEKEAGITFFFS